MKLFLLSAIIFAAFSLTAQVATKQISLQEIPASLKYKGNFKHGITWSDTSGLHTVIITETGVVDSPPPAEDGSGNANLYAYHLVAKNKIVETIWTMTDGVDNCPVDVEANYINKKIVITDLDKNGIPEIWLVYEIGCHGD